VDTTQQGFGARTVGTTTTGAAITVRNSGDAAMTMGALTAAAPFSIDQDACSSRILAAGMSCTFSVAFAPQEAGSASGSVAIPTDARVAAEAISVTGTGVAVPAPDPVPAATDGAAAAPSASTPATAAAKPIAVRARAVRGGIRVVLPVGTRSFRLQVRRNGRWVPAGVYRAPTGSRTVRVKRGTYRVVATGAVPVVVSV
ncbi:MAG: choice-of-anchor D domain-containing protein, partial [Gaiellales bacterium]